MTVTVESLRPDTLYEVQVAMVFNGRISDYGETFAVRTYSNGEEFPIATLDICDMKLKNLCRLEFVFLFEF